jgi:hypothetical protein
VGVVVNDVGSKNVRVVETTPSYSDSETTWPAILGPPKYASAFEFMLRNPLEVVAHIMFPPSS